MLEGEAVVTGSRHVRGTPGLSPRCVLPYVAKVGVVLSLGKHICFLVSYQGRVLLPLPVALTTGRRHLLDNGLDRGHGSWKQHVCHRDRAQKGEGTAPAVERRSLGHLTEIKVHELEEFMCS